MDISVKNGRVVIDGKEFQVGRSVSIMDDKVIIDGVEQEGSLVGSVRIEVFGDVDSLSTKKGNVYAKNVKSIQTVSGDIECGDVSGNIKTVSGDVSCSSIGGSVNTVSGDIETAD